MGLLALTGMILQPSLAEAQKKNKGTKPAKNPQVEMQIDMRNPKKTVKIIIELYSKEAPKTVQHFLELSNKKFYDGILFHRYVPNFVIQGGDPASKKVDGGLIADMPSEEVGEKYGLGVGGSGKNVPLEAKISHTRGTLGLARSQAPDSGDSQFFFNLVDNLRLDGNYCVFGKVIKGIENIDKLRQGDKIRSVRPVKK
jgi:cyclophilin family peptidyl-prolyl cis-trans isomerase